VVIAILYTSIGIGTGYWYC